MVFVHKIGEQLLSKTAIIIILFSAKTDDVCLFQIYLFWSDMVAKVTLLLNFQSNHELCRNVTVGRSNISFKVHELLTDNFAQDNLVDPDGVHRRP